MLELKVDGFSGPLDLLLDLIEREQLDITVLSLAQVADQYWQHVESNGGLEPDALADFILIGSRLLYIKSCALLPSASPPKEEPPRDEGAVAAGAARRPCGVGPGTPSCRPPARRWPASRPSPKRPSWRSSPSPSTRRSASSPWRWSVRADGSPSASCSPPARPARGSWG